MPDKKEHITHISVADVHAAKEYLITRAFELKKGTAPVVYEEEIKMVFEVLEAGAFMEWRAAMQAVMPQF